MLSTKSNEEALIDESWVLEFLAECDSKDEAASTPMLFTDSTPQIAIALVSSINSSSSPEEPQKKKKKSWLERCKDEISTLRQCVKQLDAELERLQMVGKMRLLLPVSASETEAALLWKKIAGRQSSLRQSSEEENRNLRNILKHHVQQSKVLQRAAKKRLREDCKLRPVQLDATVFSPLRNSQAVFDTLKAGMDDVYADLDNFYRRAKMHDLACPSRRNNTVVERAKGIFVEFLDVYELPFDLRQIEKVVWASDGKGCADPNIISTQNFTTGGNTRMRCMRFPFSIEGLDVRMDMRSVTQKYVEQDRIVFIKRTLIKPTINLMSLEFIETSRIVLKRGETSTFGPTTVMQSHREATILCNLFIVDSNSGGSLGAGSKLQLIHSMVQIVYPCAVHSPVTCMTPVHDHPIVLIPPIARLSRLRVMASIPFIDEEFLLDESSVLAFLSDFDTPCDAPTVSANSTPNQVDALATWSDSTNSMTSPDGPAKEEKKSWRQRRKEELLTLRDVVKHLETELQRLKAVAGVHSTLPNSGRALTAKKMEAFKLIGDAPHKTKTALMWESIAGRQSMLRQSSEEQNAKLRDAVKHHIQHAKTLQRAVKRKLREDLMSSSINLLRPYQLDTRGLSPPLNNKAVFDKLMAGMDDVHADLDNFFEHVRMHELPCPGRRNDTVVSKLKGMFVEFLDSYALPFSLRETEKVIWSPEPNNRSNMVFMQNFTAENNTQMKSMCFTFLVEGVSFRIVQRNVTRRYIEKGRTVFIHRTLIEPIYGNVSVSFIETGRMVLNHGRSSGLGPTTVLQTHREATLYTDLSLLDLSAYPSLDIGNKEWENSITRFNNSVEDQLIRATA